MKAAAPACARARLWPMDGNVPLSAARARALERVREIVMGVLGDEDVRVYLFGSCATGSLRPSSDIDVAVEPHRGLAPVSFATLRERLEESDVPYDVDVIDLTTVSPEFAHRVRREGILWKG
jgi:predicted nucleotidyltransferase